MAARPNQSPGNQPTYEQFLLFGDSITEQSSAQELGFGFAPALQQAYIRRLDVINRGFSGYNTVQALKILHNVVPAPEQAKVRFMMIFFGANDACSLEAHNGQHVPLDEYKDNIRRLITNPKVQAQRPRLILVTPPPVEERRLEARVKRMGYKELNRFSDCTKRYADATREVGKAHGVAILDLWRAFMIEAGWKDDDDDTQLPGARSVTENPTLLSLLPDGLHFSPDAYRILFSEMMKLIEKTWPDQMPEALPLVFPAWNDGQQWAKKGLEMGNHDAADHD